MKRKFGLLPYYYHGSSFWLSYVSSGIYQQRSMQSVPPKLFISIEFVSSVVISCFFDLQSSELRQYFGWNCDVIGDSFFSPVVLGGVPCKRALHFLPDISVNTTQCPSRCSVVMLRVSRHVLPWLRLIAASSSRSTCFAFSVLFRFHTISGKKFCCREMHGAVPHPDVAPLHTLFRITVTLCLFPLQLNTLQAYRFIDSLKCLFFQNLLLILRKST
jgi:hypothetical protein